MGLPSLDKTWQFNVNQNFPALGTAIADNKRIIRAGIKDSLKGFGTLPWTTRYSCDSVTAGSAGDGVDRWAADANLVWANAGTAHSWYVFRNANIATNFEMCMSLEAAQANGTNLMTVISPSAGFTGGSTTARPTATDEIIAENTGVNYAAITTDQTTKFHALHSTDGTCTVLFLYLANAVTYMLIIQKPKTPVTGWTNPSVCFALPSTTPVTANLYAVATKGFAKGASQMALFMTGEAYGGGNLVTQNQVVPNDLSTEYPMMPVGIASDTAANRGRHGVLFDIWWGLTGAADGDTYPNDTSRQFVQVGDLILPWNGTVIQTA